ncbi:hypothetical protein ID866_3380 [Astraeus odoratus]|nr:hypothetical protein ID866_3380 [Astraeus odoratus]
MSYILDVLDGIEAVEDSNVVNRMFTQATQLNINRDEQIDRGTVIHYSETSPVHTGPAEDPVLEELIAEATRFSINLDGNVTWDKDTYPHRGGCAIVYRGYLRPSGAKIALKTLLGGLPNDPVSHWMESGNARTYVQDIHVDPRPLILGIAQGLHYLHTHSLGPIIHGDLKGSNVLISDKGEPLITDFGYTFLTNSSFNLGVSSPLGGGTPCWMSPEVVDFLGMETRSMCPVLTKESDIWAFGMTVLELFTRDDPYHPLKPNMAVMMHISQRKLPDRPSDEKTCYRVTDDWWGICLRCWEFQPSSRPAMLQILEMMQVSADLYTSLKWVTDWQSAKFSTGHETFHFQPIQLSELTMQDFIIVLMGPTGSGKSSFVSNATGNDEGVGHALTACTSELKATKCVIGNFTNVVLVDTPNFGTGKSASQTLEIISKKICRKEVLPASILYFHRITDNRMAGTPLRSLKIFRKLCGNNDLARIMSQINLVTTMWDEVDEEVGKERLEELERKYWSTFIARGSTTFRHQNTPESARKLLQAVICKSVPQRHLHLQLEIAILKKDLEESNEGQELCNNLEQLAEKQFQVLRKLQAVRGDPDAPDPMTSGDLRREYTDIATKIDTVMQAVRGERPSRTIAFLQKMFRR